MDLSCCMILKMNSELNFVTAILTTCTQGHDFLGAGSEVMEGFVLSPAHLKPLLDFGVSKTAARWKMLGVALQFGGGELAVIETTPQNIVGGPNACLTDLLTRWLEWAPPKPWPTLDRLVDALRMDMVGEFRLAYDLENQFRSIVPATSMASPGATSAGGADCRNQRGLVSVHASSTGTQNLPLNSGTQTLPRKSDRPKFQQLHHLKCSDGRIIKVVEEAAQQWEGLAYALDFPRSTVNIVSRDNPQNAVVACGEILGKWLDGVEGTRSPISWNSLLDALEECSMNTLARDLHSVLD